MAKIVAVSEILENYYPNKIKASSFCPGCGIGIMGQAFARALCNIGIPADKVAVMCGAGCHGFTTADLACDQFLGAHGRALASATGLKLARPDLTVVAIAGDGDTGAIGGNHFIHAARRNIDVTVVISNNFIYGRTGGQYGPTSPGGSFTMTSPTGMLEPSVDLCKLAEAAGATFVARGTTYHTAQLVDLIGKGILHKGFSVIEVINQCPESYGRLNKKRMGRTGTEMMQWMRDNCISIERAKKASAEELQNKIIIGIFVEKEAPELASEYHKLIKRVQGEMK